MFEQQLLFNGILKIEKLKKNVTPPMGFEPAIPGFWDYGTPVQ